jgi:cobalt-zinc-cadmium efflux system outer membrane protein
MRPFPVAVCAAILASSPGALATVPAGDEAPVPSSSLSLAQALAEAEARAPTLVAAAAEVEAARGKLRQAGFRPNPELTVEVENVAGSGPYRGVGGAETTVSLNQRLDLGGRRSARLAHAQAQLAAQEIRLSIARAALEQSVRVQFATAIAARKRLTLARVNQQRARNLTRIADELVSAGREPPLRGLRARSALAQADAAVRGADAEELAARRSLAALIGLSAPPATLRPGDLPPPAGAIDAGQTLEVRLAEAERAIADSALAQERAAARLDPSIGIGVRQLRETGDHALVAGFSLPLTLFDRNQGNIAAARSGIRAADARRNDARAQAEARLRNAQDALAAADARVTALDAEAVPHAAEALRLTDLSYRAGRSPLIELLDAQAAYAAARSQLIDAQLARATAVAVLARAAAR